ncbi:GATOR complex protein NPRL2 [Cimex lectularius]|uniref:Nitrogen permease regulator 2-like protein n=1 Tax=Cimex lectularius TaxID=79782 RepID=A0A8I6S6U6_CIMLE|nr:GATOR complex protein NPRL2 [Cimex lectularius]
MEKNNRFFEGCGKEGPIRCIFYCEFHPTAGPKITCQVPEDFISKDTFEAVSVYLIPKTQLLRSTLTITTSGIKILGFPVRIDNKKYPRNAFYFNICFVCDSWARTVQYESVVKKLSDFLTALEVESSFLYQRDGETGSNTSKLVLMLEQVMRDLNSYGMCTVTEGNSTTNLKVIKIRPDPPPVLDHQVPVFIESLEAFQCEQWDLTTQQVLPLIDGINHVSKIAAQADVENNLVKTCLQNLVYYLVVSLVPIFQYSNSYAVTPKLRRLVVDKKLQEDCLRTVARTGWQLPHFRDVFKLYCSMTHGTTVKDLCIRYNPSSLRIDERKLVQFGLVEGLIRRIHKYPIVVMEGANGEASSLYQHFTGLLSLDEICCNLGMSTFQLETLIEKDPNVIVICK